MNINDLKPASQLAQNYGVKAIMYGNPGTGKTPLIKTAPRPVLCAVEPGMLSMRDAHNVPTWEAYTPQRADEFFKWLFQSKEADQFDTVGIDSLSQLSELYLIQELARNKDGRKAYGEMSRRIMELVTALYYFRKKHIYLIAKQIIFDDNGVQKKRPYFPGQDLNAKIPHLYDEVLHIGLTVFPGQPKPLIAIRTQENYDTLARDRSGNLDELEPPDLSHIFNKAMR